MKGLCFLHSGTGLKLIHCAVEGKVARRSVSCDVVHKSSQLGTQLRSLRHVLGGRHDGFDDLFISGATADVAVHKVL